MTPPKVRRTLELIEALTDLEQLKLDLFIAGVDHDKIDELVDAVRLVDAETVKARLVFRNEEEYPYYPESFETEREVYEITEQLLRGPLPGAEADDPATG